MPSSVAALQILLILLPGFASAYFVQLIAIRARQNDLDKVIEALLFSFLIYVSNSLIHRGQLPVTFSHNAQGDAIDFHPGNLLWLTGLSLFFGVAMAAYVQWDGTRLWRKLNLTERTSRNSIWNDAFQDVRQTVDPSLGTFVQVELKDGRSVMGVVSFTPILQKSAQYFFATLDGLVLRMGA